MKKIIACWEKITPKQKTAGLMLLIVGVGFFLRSYNFSEWLRFNADQSRDAALIENIDTNGGFPLLGPKAGGTEFKLGSAFYVFQLAAAKIFGSEPDKVAYPDLLFSILAIVLMYLLAKNIFNPRIALALAWLYAISFFVIKYSRFAWNPNSTPFFAMLFLYSAYQIFVAGEKQKIYWEIASGLALGILVQLHTSLLIIMPVLALIVFVLLWKEKRLTKAGVTLIICSAFFVNVPQIFSEIQTQGNNTKQFFEGVTSKNERNSSIAKNIGINVSCHFRVNNHILTSLESQEECDYRDAIKKIKSFRLDSSSLGEIIWYGLLLAAVIVFNIGGYALMWASFKNADDLGRKFLQKTIILYVLISFLFYVTWATELSVRFFLPLSFIPFLLVGYWIKHMNLRFNREMIWILLALVTLSAMNLTTIIKTYKDLEYGGRSIAGKFEYITLGEGRKIVDFAKRNASDKKVILDAQSGYLFKSIRSLNYLSKKDRIKFIEMDKNIKLRPGDQQFYIINAKNNCKLPDRKKRQFEVERCEVYRQFSIFALRVK